METHNDHNISAYDIEGGADLLIKAGKLLQAHTIIQSQLLKNLIETLKISDITKEGKGSPIKQLNKKIREFLEFRVKCSNLSNLVATELKANNPSCHLI